VRLIVALGAGAVSKVVAKLVAVLKRYQCDNATLNEVEAVLRQTDDFPHLYHYIADADIRLRDVEYATTQNCALASFIEAVEQGELENARAITFLK